MPGKAMFPHWVVRENLLRVRDNAPELTAAPYASIAFRLFRADGVLMEHNVVALEQPNLIRHLDSGPFHCFDNRKPSGELVRGQSVENTGGNTTLEDGELATLMADLIEDALILAL